MATVLAIENPVIEVNGDVLGQRSLCVQALHSGFP